MTEKKKTYKMAKDTYTYKGTTTHDKMIEAFQQYFYWNNRFEFQGLNLSGTKARYWLHEIFLLSKLRREEIHTKKKHRKSERPSTPGRIKNIPVSYRIKKDKEYEQLPDLDSDISDDDN